MSLQTPVALFLFNRPDLTAQVFAAIARAEPRRLLLIADGPRDDTEAELCRAARAVVSRIDWPCEVETHFSDSNLGCQTRISSGLDWVFSRVEAAIILEDDCLPSPSFFGWCEVMLARFRDDPRVMHISGDNFAPLSDADASYRFSRYVHVWGWASWRRAWRFYDVSLQKWPAERERVLAACADEREMKFWDDKLSAVKRGEIDTWDYQWQFACWLEGGLAAVPRVNLVSNLGFRADATHDAASKWANLPAFEFAIENHPPEIVADTRADARERKRLIYALKPPIWRRALGKLARTGRRKSA